MVSTFTPNIQLEEPARGDDVGVWDTPVNSNTTVVDLVTGAISVQSLNNSNIILSAAQFRSKTITFNSTLTGSVTITFPTTFIKSYEIQHLCTGSSAFTITLATTAAGGQVICAPPGVTIDVLNDGSNLKFKNLWGPVGSYFDYAASSVPNWVTGCTVPPLLNCDGTTFSSATYPTLATILGSTTVPDRRGTAGYTLNQGTGRLTSAFAGIDGNTIFSVKSSAGTTIGTSNQPAYTPTGVIGILTTGGQFVLAPTGGSVGVGGGLSGGTLNSPISTGTFTGNAQGGVSAPLPVVASATIYGITMIRSA